MGLKCGIIGLPNVGKSTIFNALTSSNVAAANYPFCTIDPNIGVVNVPDDRLLKIAKIVNPLQIVPTTAEFVDIAGLVAGASKGEGRGNQFLAHIREVDALAQIVRCFSDDQVTHVSGKVNPLSDISTINTELILADLDTVSKALKKVSSIAKSRDKRALEDLSVLESVSSHLNQGNQARTLYIPAEKRTTLDQLRLLTMKPLLYVANIEENGILSPNDNEYLRAVKIIAEKENSFVVTICAKLEEEISKLDDESERMEFIKSSGLSEPGLCNLIRAGYSLLKLITFFTAGEKEARAWTITNGTTAENAAGIIHSDFKSGFVKAKIISYEDFLVTGGEEEAKKVGKCRFEGREYIMKDGDVVHFMSSL